jgi:uncharacterized protein YcnI
MACGRKSFPPLLAATLTTAFVSIVGMLAFAPPASARVSVVPGSVQGGGTATFAVRLANEQPDLVTTRLELTFPKDVVVPRVEVAAVGKWRAKVEMRRVDPPVTIAGDEVDTAVASIVWTGGEVAPKQFEQFLVTAGPLPEGGGKLVLAAAQGYEDGTVDKWTAPAKPGWPGAPTISIAPVAGAAPAQQPAETPGTPVQAAAAAATATAAAEPDDGGTGVLPWILLAAAVLVAGVGSVLGYRQQERRKRLARRRLRSVSIEQLRTGAGRR